MKTLNRLALKVSFAALATLAVAAGVTATPDRADDPRAGQAMLFGGSEESTVSLTVHDSGHDAVTNVPVGSFVHLRIAVTGDVHLIPTGDVYLQFWEDATCTVNGTDPLAVPLVDGLLDTKAFWNVRRWVNTTISFRVSYEGDGTFAPGFSACKAVTYTKIDPVVVLRAHDPAHDEVTAVSPATSLHLLVDVNGRAKEPTGDVVLNMYSNGTCTGSPVLGTNELALTDSMLHPSPPFVPGSPGAVSFRAAYSGDGAYNSRGSACVKVTVGKIEPVVAWSMHQPDHEVAKVVPIGTTVHGAVAATGSEGAPTGMILIREYATDTCAGDFFQITGKPIASLLDPFRTTAFDAPTTRWFEFEYKGDDVYEALFSACMPVTWVAAPTVTLTVHDAEHEAATTEAKGSALHARIKVAGEFGTPTGAVKVTWWSNATCDGTGEVLGIPTLSGEGVVDKLGLDIAPTKVGSYSFKARYLGDTSYAARSSACKAVTIAAATGSPNPTDAPAATAAPTAAAGLGPDATLEPAGTAGTDESAAPTTVPLATQGRIETPAPAASGAAASPSANEDSTAAPNGAAGPTTPSGDAGLGAIVLLVVMLLLVIAAFVLGAFVARRRGQDGARQVA